MLKELNFNVKRENPTHSRRGESNSKRKGISKVHRRVKPSLDALKVPLRANRLTRVVEHHNFNQNKSFINQRIKNEMRLSIRSERRESMRVACIVCIAFTDFHPDREEGIFEVRRAIEDMAKISGMLTVYESGRKAYDCFLKALETIQEAGGMIIRKAKDPDTKQWKPHRIFLTPEFFKWFGMDIHGLRKFVLEHKRWLVKNGLEKSDKEKYEAHLLKMARFKIKDAEKNSHYSLKKLLKKIQRYVVGEDLQNEKNQSIGEIKKQIKAIEEERRLEKIKTEAIRYKEYYALYAQWRNTHSTEDEVKIAFEVRKRDPYIAPHTAAYYKLFLQIAGVIPSYQ